MVNLHPLTPHITRSYGERIVTIDSVTLLQPMCYGFVDFILAENQVSGERRGERTGS